MDDFRYSQINLCTQLKHCNSSLIKDRLNNKIYCKNNFKKWTYNTITQSISEFPVECGEVKFLQQLVECRHILLQLYICLGRYSIASGYQIHSYFYFYFFYHKSRHIPLQDSRDDVVLFQYYSNSILFPKKVESYHYIPRLKQIQLIIT